MGPPASRRVTRVRRYSGAAPAQTPFRLRGFHPLRPRFPAPSARNSMSFERSSTPPAYAVGLGSFPFARRYLGNRSFFLFLRVLRCFSSPRCLRLAYFVRRAMPVHCDGRVPPFGHPRFAGYLPLPVAFRSLSRPSSAPSAKASASCPFSLDLSSLAWSSVTRSSPLSIHSVNQLLFLSFSGFSMQNRSSPNSQPCLFSSWLLH